MHSQVTNPQTEAPLAPFDSSGGSCRDEIGNVVEDGRVEGEVVAAHAGRRLRSPEQPATQRSDILTEENHCNKRSQKTSGFSLLTKESVILWIESPQKICVVHGYIFHHPNTGF